MKTSASPSTLAVTQPGSRFEWAGSGERLAPKDVNLLEITKYLKRFTHDLVDQGVLQEVGEHHDYLRTWRLHAPDVWQQVAVVVFPYAHDAWSRLLFERFRIEGDRWRRWCSAHDASRSATGSAGIAPLWSGLDTLTDSAGTHFMGEHSIAGLPALVRPYLPWPTLEERPMAADARASVLKTLGAHDVPDSAVISDGERALPLWWSLADRTLPDVVRDVLMNKRAVEGVTR
ncbi:MAG TPA: hypothetical protein VF432_15795 [Thermoanaerobaculia bacterium]